MPRSTSSRLNSVREVEEELRIRSGGNVRSATPARSWEFKGVRVSVGASLRRLGHRFSGSHRASGGSQRVIVKASFTVHKMGRGRGVLQAHVRYLGRDSASLDGQPGRFYDAARETVDARATVHEWEQDRHHFRLIVSPEQADQLDRQRHGLKGYIREWVARVERDLGTKLQWIAVNHHNTDDLHAHVLLRGKRGDGKDLVLPRKYLSHGLREAAQEIATRRLGPRTAEQARGVMQKELSAERYTPLDAAIERQLDGNRRLRLRRQGASSDSDRRRLIAARLQHLQNLGLATRDRHGRWTLPPDLKPRLRALSERGDIIKNLHAKLGRASASVESYRGQGTLAGHVVSIGTHDELRGSQYVLVRDLPTQRLHYARVANAGALRGLETGGIVRVSGTDPRRARLDATIAEVAHGNGGVYTTDAHRARLPTSLTPAEMSGILKAHEHRLATLLRSSVVERTSSGWIVREVEALSNGAHARAHGTTAFIEVLSGRSVQSHVDAQAWTWLDRQMHRLSRGQSTEVPFDAALDAAADARRRWMIEKGYAAIADGLYQLRPAAAQELRRYEWQQVSQEHQRRHGNALLPLPSNAEVQGRYRGTLALHAGPHAMVASRDRTYLVPVPRTPITAYGTAVVARVLPNGRGMVVAAPPRLPSQLERE